MMRRRNGKEYSCEPCRKAKTRCDHGRPVCAKCISRRRTSHCFYHPAPMTQPRQSEQAHSDPSSTDGLISHIFPDTPGTEILRLLSARNQLYRGLIDAYLETAQIRVVPKPLITALVASTENLDISSDERIKDTVKRISANTQEAIICDGQENFSTYCDQFTGQNLRWESLGIFFALLSSSAMLLPRSDPLVQKSRLSAVDLAAQLVQASSSCLELWRTSGPINDIAVMLMYQHLIVTSLHFGDADRRTWRRLVDLAGAIFEAGLYLSADENSTTVPLALVEIRRRLFAASYSIDKTLCTAHGRPPTVAKHYCRVSLPLELDESMFLNPTIPNYHMLPELVDDRGWSLGGTYCSMTWLRLRYSLAVIREELLAVLLGTYQSDSEQKLRHISDKCSAEWDSFPPHTKYPEAVVLASRTYRQRLLLASIYIDYLSLEFQIQREICRLHGQIETALVDVAQNIISMILTITTPSEHATEPFPRGFSWIVTLYGIQSAHVLLEVLAKILQPNTIEREPSTHSRGKIIRNLTGFLARLDFIIPLQDGNASEMKETRQKLSETFDAVVDSLRTHESSITTTMSPIDHFDQEIEFLSSWESWPVGNPAYLVEGNNDIWRI
ncbi:hypothetical protein HD806DRAFT_319595 [Xylariaceae sp. AK1471]|nr:hypothetical protein HD806DRAFT_319595 [Xylariaceae sp. AK1471]